ncbi:cyclin-dependent kinase 11B-like isoform X2 [Dreissena polymorpha]|uniref:cyclin-dependent kinase 11B-like isoform X2 n=1 Tax=Dreissena polymorpha TaxID=45954 RepID=UPI0022646DBD|nr:cyclin-dependent kinase 11B-like isoform X2 [Dreissena polymorpha]
MSRRKVTLVSDRSPVEQGELASSSPEVEMRSMESEEEEEEQGDEQEEEQTQSDDNRSEHVESDDDDDGLLIKPPPVPVKKKHKHKQHKDEKRREKHKEHRKEGREDLQSRGDQPRGARDRPEREVRIEPRDDRPRERNKPLMSGRERERELKEKLIKEQEKREKSRMERERLERLEREKARIEREKTREHRIREEREKREYERRRRKDEDRRLQQMRKEREEIRNRKERAMEKDRQRHGERSRSHSREWKDGGRDVRPRGSRDVSEQSEGRRESKRASTEVQQRTQQSPPPDSVEWSGKREKVESETESRKTRTVTMETEEQHSASEDDSDDSADSDSGSGGSYFDKHFNLKNSDTGSEGSSVKSGQSEHGEKQQIAKSKFDDQSEPESETESVHLNDHHSDGDFLTETPPMSPVELKPDLPPYYPAIQGCRSVEEFSCLNRIEEGTYGVVYRARDKKTDEIVALKRLKMEKEKEGFPITSLREINTLLKAQHHNIVTVREIVVGSNMDKIYIVMDYVEHDLKSLMTESMKQPFLVGEAKTLLMQLLRGVNHLHDNWIIHRDLKTSNLLLSHKGILKIGDFGLAREYGEPLKQYTPIVVTLWYRAPELLLGCKEYSTPIDMWSVGCIFAEFMTMKAIWQGTSDIDQLQKIFKDLGTPTEKIWPGLMELPGMKKCTFTEYPYNTLRNKFGQYLSDQGFTLLNRFLTYNPEKRITAVDAMKHEYFRESPLPIDPSMFPTWPAKSEQVHKRASSPKPPSGGKAYSKLLDDGDDAITGFQFREAAKGVSATGMGFSLKF